ncbi:hypothetical protein A1F97_06819 [Pyrenophora tritici-repentis]|nr:hypothetical protein A1F95_04544 [Pyrenophora tritici-repentis]PZD32747.1 hypothetical protein A1F96_02671 [Pyrenophora tritici-repentis]PZD38336.1 hypothetical protein A1F97_06819 [Pyrenophora tritici-repentis]
MLQKSHSPIIAKSPPFKTASVTITEVTTPPSPEANPAPRPQRQILRDPASITTEFDELRFNAAAYTQLIRRQDQNLSVHKIPDQENEREETSCLLISSPYNLPGHYLDITSPALPTSSRLFALALTALKPIVETYATTSYTSALNLDDVLSLLRDLVREEEEFKWKETSFYVVTFRSKLKESVDNDSLYKLDAESHREACESGGLLKYWFGKTDGERRNLATCFWHSREDAYKGGLGPWHRKARAAGRELYESIIFTTHRFTVLDGAEGYRFEDWNA